VASGYDDARPTRHWTPDQVGKFLTFVATRGELPAGLVEVLADTGARAGETVGLRWTDLDLDAATARIARQLVGDPHESKPLEVRRTKRPRHKSVVSLHPATVAALRRRRAQQAAEVLRMGAGWPTDRDFGDLVFTWPDGRPPHPKTMSRILARLAERAGLPRLGAHGLRHSFATAALTARVPVEVVAARLGNTPRIVHEGLPGGHPGRGRGRRPARR